MAASSYRSLKPDRIIKAQRELCERIAKRFPGSGLSEVAAELLVVAEEAAVRAERIRRPNLPLRVAVAVLLAAAVVFVVALGRFVHLQINADLLDVMNLVQFIESGVGTLVFIGAAVVFLLSLELRWKRRRALAAIHELRAIAHVIDMHQVAKDPEGLLRRGPVASKKTDATTKTLFELNRYLNYCNELLAILSKVAAVYVQDFPDASAVAAVDEIEALCSGLSHRIWQKIMILEDILDEPGSASAAVSDRTEPSADGAKAESAGQGSAGRNQGEVQPTAD